MATDIKTRPVDVTTSTPSPVTISMDVERHLLYDLNALEELENIYGELGIALNSLASDRQKIKHIKNFIYAGLLHEDSTITPEKVAKMIGYHGLTVITDQIWQAFGQDLPDPDEESTPGEQ